MPVPNHCLRFSQSVQPCCLYCLWATVKENWSVLVTAFYQTYCRCMCMEIMQKNSVSKQMFIMIQISGIIWCADHLSASFSHRQGMNVNVSDQLMIIFVLCSQKEKWWKQRIWKRQKKVILEVGKCNSMHIKARLYFLSCAACETTEPVKRPAVRLHRWQVSNTCWYMTHYDKFKYKFLSFFSHYSPVCTGLTCCK